MDLNKAYKALKNAHNAGDVDAARTIAKAINNFNKETEIKVEKALVERVEVLYNNL